MLSIDSLPLIYVRVRDSPSLLLAADSIVSECYEHYDKQCAARSTVSVGL